MSGVHTHLADACSLFVPPNRSVQLVNKKAKRLASLNLSEEMSIVIITNCPALLPLDDPVAPDEPLNFLRSMPYMYAEHLFNLPNATTEQFLSACAFTPHPTLGAAADRRDLILFNTGHDMAAPVNSHGEMTNAVLRKLSKARLTMIAEVAHINPGGKKADLLARILEEHQLASKEDHEAPITKAAGGRKRKAQPIEINRDELHNAQREVHKRSSDLMKLRDETSLRALYRENYGLEDRFNAMLYTCFRLQNASEPTQKLHGSASSSS